ncbi:MAG TPA: hypothetical protein VF744_17940 [Beijerinckiaceae bacterium]
MATATLHHIGFSPRAAALTDRPSVLRRLWAALSRSGRHGEEAEIAEYIEMRGGRITDALERDIERRFMSGRF